MPNKCENRLLSLLSAQEWHLDRLYAEYAKQFGSIFRNHNGSITKAKRKELDRVLGNFNTDLESTLASQISNSFGISDLCNDELSERYLKGLETPEKDLNKIFAKNPSATQAFLQRKAAGFTLSQRVWNLTQQTEAQLTNALETGIFNGRSAAEMARDLKRYLKEPDQRFRRLKNAEGKLVLSNPAKEYNPGRGVYRSSYKNALRLSRNEINIAYRTNDFERRKNMPFVMGYKVRLSAAHPAYDICDELVGTYPKEFKFTGWHPNCLCVSDAILLPREKFKDYLGGGKIDERYLIKSVPKNALDYLNDNAQTIRGWKNTPYFIKDNYKYSDGKYIPKVAAAPKQSQKILDRVDPAEVQSTFIAAKTRDEATQRIINSGVKEVNLKGLKPEEFNAVLEAVESESKFGVLNLSSLTTYRSSGSYASALYSPSNNSISINLSNIKKFKKDTVIPYSQQLIDLEKTREKFKNDYLGDPRYKQTTVRARINSMNNRIYEVQRKIKDGEKARIWSVSSGAKDKNDALRITTIHEIGHYRHFKQIGESKYFAFQKRNSITEYGRTNNKEFFAEWYAQYRVNGEKGVPKDLLEYFKTIPDQQKPIEIPDYLKNL